MNYWRECIEEAFDDAGLTATKEQIDTVVTWVEVAHDGYGLATGKDIVDANYVSDAERELSNLKEEIEKRRAWEIETGPCEHCITSIKDMEKK